MKKRLFSKDYKRRISELYSKGDIGGILEFHQNYYYTDCKVDPMGGHMPEDYDSYLERYEDYFDKIRNHQLNDNILFQDDPF